MERAIQQFRKRFADTTPWISVAIIVAVGLLVFFVAQGTLYWQASGSNSSVQAEIDSLEKAIKQFPSGLEEQEAQLEAANLRLETMRLLFDYPATDTLMSIVSDTAGVVGLDLVSMTADDVVIVPKGEFQYRVRPISVVLDGSTADVREFLAVLYNRAPVVVASNARMVNLDSNPSTQIQLRFYLSPEPVVDDDEQPPG